MPKIESKHYIGIDPGQSGGLAIVSSGWNTIADPMPNTERDIWNWFEGLGGGVGTCQAVIEKVHSFPGQGVASTFKFGMGYGGLRMCLVAAGISFEAITPQTWQKGLGIPKRKKTESNTQWKNRLKAKAQELFPDITITLKTADALLIAEFCRRKHRGLL